MSVMLPDAEQTQPGIEHVIFVEGARASPHRVSGAVHATARESIERPANQVAKRMAAQRVARKERPIREKDQRGNAHPERPSAVLRRPNQRVDEVLE
jgi:hypothetical protein